MAEGQPLWHGRLVDPPADALWAFTSSIDFDRALAAEDVEGSRAHARMLSAVGLLEPHELDAILDALGVVERELADGSFVVAPTDEDVHTAVERRVTELAGSAGGKLHTGRSRNDQVATDLRLWLRHRGREVVDATGALQRVLLARARGAGEEIYLPGYTHLQRAQPVLLAHHLLAHFWALARDVDRWRDCLARADVSPLGAGALAGTSLPIDPAMTARELGFDRPFDNSLDAVSDRDFVAEALFVVALEQVHLSRLGEEIILWASDEFGFLTLDDRYSTGSSMMPHKKNPDIAELARGKAGRTIGNLTAILTTLKGLPLAYNRDLQEDKEPLFDSVDTVIGALEALTGLLETAGFVPERMRAAADVAGAAATDLAEHLVRGGTPFREAHHLVGTLVRQAAERGVPLEELVMTEPALGPDALHLLEPGAAVRRRTSAGGAGPQPVAAQLAAADRHLTEQLAGPG
jgi:argininosuccinate lyase